MGDVSDFFNEKRVPIDSGKRNSGKYPYYGASGVIDYVDGYIFDGEFVLLAEDGANIVMRNSPIAYLTQGKFWLNNHAHIMKIKDGSNDFLLQILEKQNFEKYNSGTAQPKLNSQVVKKIVLHFPEKTEQEKIGAFFKRLESTITLQQRKIEQLQQLKKGFLQKMFPSGKETVPQVRFAHFDEEWEQRKLEEVLTVNSGRDYKHLKPGNIPVYGTGGYMLSVNDTLSDKDGIGIGRKGTIDKPQYLEAPFWTVDTLFFMTPKANYEINFVFFMSKSINWKRMDESTGVPSLSKKVIENVKKKFPMYEEQEKIGAFFKRMEDNITLQQNKLGKLQSIKKSLLQKMFV